MGWCHPHLGLTFLPHLNLSGVSSWACLEVCLCGGPNLAKSAVKMNYHAQCLRTWLTFQQDLGVLHKAPKGGQAPLSQSMIYMDYLGMGTSYSPWSYFSVISQAPTCLGVTLPLSMMLQTTQHPGILEASVSSLVKWVRKLPTGRLTGLQGDPALM